MVAWLAVLAAMGVAGWFTGKGMHQSALAKQAGVDEQRSKRQQPMVKRIPYPADSAEARWMEEVRLAGPGDYEELCMQCRRIFSDSMTGYPYTPETADAMRWVMGQWYLADREGFLEKGPAIHTDAFAEVVVGLDPGLAVDLMIIDPDLEVNPFDRDGERLGHCIALCLLKYHPDLLIQQDWHEQNLGDVMDVFAWNDAIEELARKDVMKAAAIYKLAHCGRDEELANGLHRMLRHWDTTDPRRKEWLGSLEHPRLKYMAYQAHWELLSQTDPMQAIEEMFEVELTYEERWQVDISMVVLRRCAQKDPSGSIRLLKRIEDDFVAHPESSFDGESPAMKAWAASNPFSQHSDGHEHREWVEEGEVRYELVELMMRDLPDEPSELFTALRKLTADAGVGDALWRQRFEGSFIIEKARYWSVENCLTAAQQWKPLVYKDGQDWVMRTLAMRAAERDPRKIIHDLERYPNADKGVFLREAIAELSAADSELGLSLLPEVPVEIWTEHLGWSLSRDPETYASFVVERAAEANPAILHAFAQGWADDDPQAAAVWVLSLDDSKGMESAMSGLIEEWVKFDPDPMLDWVGKLPEGNVKESASESLVKALINEEPIMALEWANSITDPVRRAKSYENIAKQWEDAPEYFQEAHRRIRQEAGLPPLEEQGGEP